MHAIDGDASWLAYSGRLMLPGATAFCSSSFKLQCAWLQAPVACPANSCGALQAKSTPEFSAYAAIVQAHVTVVACTVAAA
jgi:hypothetical protein